ncbi:MAG: CoA-binding protein [Chloroflexota bacterium]
MECKAMKHMEALFDPRSVAVVGASDRFGTWGYGIIRRLASSPFRGVWPVNNREERVMGLQTYRSILEVPDLVDFAVISVSSAQVPLVMRQCVQKGVKAALVVSGGMSEAGEDGARVEAEAVEIAREGGLRFIGPNSMGHCNTAADFSTLAWLRAVPAGPIGFVSQSGTYGQRFIRHGMEAGVGFSKFISSGNEADLHLEDYLEYLGRDPDTRLIALYIEGLREGKRFYELAREITMKKPIVAMKAGRTHGAAGAARSHTAALVGDDDVYTAMFKQCGVIRVDEEDEFFDVAFALLHVPVPRGRRVAILTEGGGIGVVASDACERVGLELARLSPRTLSRLDSLLPPRWSHGNPADMTDAVTSGKLVTFDCLSAVMDDEGVDAAMLIGGLGAAAYFRLLMEVSSEDGNARQLLEDLDAEESENVRGLDRRLAQSGKPLVISRIMPKGPFSPPVFEELQRKGVPVYPTPERAAKVLKHLAWYGEYLRSTKSMDGGKRTVTRGESRASQSSIWSN